MPILTLQKRWSRSNGNASKIGLIYGTSNQSDPGMAIDRSTWWLIPLSKWVITLVISGLILLIPFITGVITHLLSGMNHQVMIPIRNFKAIRISNHRAACFQVQEVPFSVCQPSTMTCNAFTDFGICFLFAIQKCVTFRDSA